MSSDWLDRWNRALREQHKLLFDYSNKRMKDEFAHYADCPVCGEKDAKLHYEKDWFKYYKCRNCSMVYMNPRMNDAATHSFYNSSANAIYNESKFDNPSVTSDFDNDENISNLDAIERHRSAGKKGGFLEIGSATGHLLKKAKEYGYDVYGIELNKKMCIQSRSILGDTIYDVDLQDVRFPAEMFDVIYMRDLIQHIPEPKGFLLECNRIAKPGATIFIGTHNIEGLIQKVVKEKYTAVFGFMEPNHFSPLTIRKILDIAGFEVKEIHFRSIDVTLGTMISYFGTSSFTYVYPPELGKLRRFGVKMLYAPFFCQPLRYMDTHITPSIANWLKQGSWMNVIAEKR